MDGRQIILIYGKTGMGKSTKAKEIISGYDRVIIIDPKAEYDGLVFTDCVDMIEYYEANEPEKFIFICRFQTDVEHESVFKFCEVIENVLLVVEECEIYISPKSQSSYFYNLCRYGRHHNVSVLGIARRSGEISIGFRSLVTKIISFKQTEPRDVKYMDDLGLHDVDKIEPHEFIEVIP
jgi:hypothetical protein